MPSDSIPFDLASIRRVPKYEWRELEREGQEPLRIKSPSLTIGQIDAIPYSKDTPLRDAFQAIAGYVVEWNLTGEDVVTGETTPVPPPAEAGWEVLTLLHHDEALWVVTQVRHGHLMRTDDQKKGSSKSSSTPAPSSAKSSA